MARKRRTPAQIRATKKLVALNRRRARQNAAGPKKTWRRRAKSARQMKRGHRATAAWVRSGMPSQRNRKRSSTYIESEDLSGHFTSVPRAKAWAQATANRLRRPVTLIQHYSGGALTGNEWTVHPKKKNPRCNPRRKGLTVQQAIKLAKAARRGVAVGIKATRKGYSVVTGKAARALAKRKSRS